VTGTKIVKILWLTIFLTFLVIEQPIIEKKSSPPRPGPQVQAPSADTVKKSPQVFEEITFPENFFFGTASSDFQTTGGTGVSDWNVYIENCVKDQRKCRRQDDPRPFSGPGSGTDFLNRYKEDFDLAQQISPLVHRISLEWSRIEPEEGKWNDEAIKKYAEIFRYMRSKGVEPMICLNHFALPLWLSEAGGWENPRASYYYSRYAEVVAQRLGKPLNIKWWLTFNEPQVMLAPYTNGGWPPDKPINSYQDSEGAERVLKVASHMADSHRLAYRNIHKVLGSDVMVSFASAPNLFYPKDPDSSLDLIAYNIYNSAYTMLFDLAIGSTDRDFIGLNYYGRYELIFHISLWNNALRWLTEDEPFSIEWQGPLQRRQGNRPVEFYPKGLYDLIMKFKGFNMPIVITENGINDIDDKFREEFLVIHLKAVHDAIRDGADVIGYQYWALTDTWEWDGNFSGFGLMKIERDNDLARNLRPSALTYGQIVKTRKISKELLEKHKELLEVKE
jgi:beta-glucosidase